MASYVQHPRSTVTGAMPPGTLPIGVLAVNFPDKRLTTIDAGSVVVNLGRRIEPHNAALAYKQHDIIIDAVNGLRVCLADIPPKAFTASDWGATSTVLNAIVPNPPPATSQRITGADAADVPLSLRGFAGQTANLQQWENSAGAVLASMSATGLLTAAALSAATLNGIAVTDFARLSANDQSFAGAVVRFANAAGGRIVLQETDAAVGQKTASFQMANTSLRITLATDALSIVENALVITGNAASEIVSIALAADTITLNGVNANDYARLSQVNTFTGAAQVYSNAAGPYFRLTDPDALAGARNIRIRNLSQQFAIQSETDALATGATLLIGTMDGTSAWTSLALTAGSVNLNGATTINSSSPNPLRLVAADAIGDCYISFYEPGIVNRKAYLGYGITTTDLFQIVNEESGGGITLTATAGVITLNGVDVADYVRKTPGALQTIVGSLILSTTAPSYVLTETDAAVDSQNWSIRSSAGSLLITAFNNAFTVSTDAIALARSGTTLTSITIAPPLITPNLSAAEVGYKGAPQNTQAGSYTAVLSDAGKSIKLTGVGAVFTLPAHAAVAFPEGTVIVVYNRSGSPITVAAPSLVLGDGNNAPGNRTVANNSFASLYHNTGGEWIISGSAVA